jgi:hypothetical protein
MKSFQFEGMYKIAPAMEQAKIAGLIKEPELLKQEKKQNYILYGILISCVVFSSYFMVQSYFKKQNQREVN